MSWELLDFRIGRANRLQFWLTFVMFLLAVWLANSLDSSYIAPFIFAIALYFVSLVGLRRMHDLKVGYSSVIGTDEDDIMFTAKITHQWNLLFFPMLLFGSSDPYENKYGFPPEGLNFKSMISKCYSKKQLKEIDDAIRTHYVTKQNTEHDTSQYEVKGRNL